MSDQTPPPPPPGYTPPPPPPHVEAGYVPPPPPKQPGSGAGGCLKFGLIGCGAMLVLALLIGVAGAIWWKHSGKEVTSRAEGTMAEGERAGAGTDEAGCYRLAQARPGKGPIAAVSTSMYMQACLGKARVTPDFCEGVPNPDEAMASARWRAAACPGSGTDVRCQALAQGRQLYCHDSRPKKLQRLSLPPGDSAGYDDQEGQEDTAGSGKF